jgi:hypothetical protein
MINGAGPITAVLYLKKGGSTVVMQDPGGNEFCRT